MLAQQTKVEALFSKVPEFKEWVEKTCLFNKLVYETNHKPVGVDFHRIQSDEISIDLREGIKINKAEDLPVQLLREFFLNSPFYLSENYELIKLLT